MKKLLSILLIAVMLFGICSLGGCNKYGRFYTLKEAYETGEITREDLLSIAYYSGNAEYNKKEINDKFTPQCKEELNEDICEKILSALVEKEQKEYSDESISNKDIVIDNYYGNYSGWFAFKFHNLTVCETTVDKPYIEEIAGVSFFYNNSKRIQMWREV